MKSLHRFDIITVVKKSELTFLAIIINSKLPFLASLSILQVEAFILFYTNDVT